MKKLFVFFLTLSVILILGCGGGKKDDGAKTDTDATDADVVDDADEPGSDSGDTAQENDDDADSGDTEPQDTDNPETPDNDTDSTPIDPEATENHKISGIYQAGAEVSGIEAALYECGKTEKIASSNTDADGNFSFNTDISAAKTYCVKANNFASCFKGSGDHVANISEITNAAYLIDKNCADLRESETKIRAYVKLGTGGWLGELDYSALSGIREGLKLLSNYLAESDTYKLSEKIAEDAKKDAPEFEKFFNGFKAFSDKSEVVIGTDGDNADFGVEGGSTTVAPNFKIVWTLKNKTAEAATYRFTTSIPGEYTARAKLIYGGETVSDDSATVLFLQRKGGGTVYISDTSKNISFRIDDGIYGVIPKGSIVKRNGKKINSISYTVLSAGGNQISRLKFEPEGAEFFREEGGELVSDGMYFVHELGTVYGGDPKVLTATRTNADGSVDVIQSAAGDPIMMAAAGDPIMTTAAGDPIMQAAAGDPIMTNALGDPIMMTTGMGDPIMGAAQGDPIMGSAMGDPIMGAAMGDPIMMGTSSSTMISQTNHYSTFTVEAAYLPISVDALVARWSDGSYYNGYSPIEFIRLGVETYKPDGAEKTRLLSYLTEEKLADLGSDLYELINKPVGFQRNLNLFENLFFVSEFYNRMSAKRENGAVAAVRNGLELRSAIAALYTATTSYNRSTTLADFFDPTMIPLTYSGKPAKDYTSRAMAAMAGNAEADERYIATKREMMIFANYITTSSKGPDFSSVDTILNPDQLVCAWFNNDTDPASCNKVYTLNSAGHVTLGGTEVSVAEANKIFTDYFMPMNTRLSDDEKLDLFRTLYLALKYAGTIFYNGADVEELNDKLLETAYLVFDGIDGNANAVTITDTFDASAHTVSVLDENEMATRPYLKKLSALTDKISLKVAAESANVEKVLINIEGHEFEKVQENTRTYYKPTGDLKEKSIILAPGTLAQGEKALSELLGSENVDELGSITGKMTIVVNSKIGSKNYTTQRTYDFFANDDSDGVSTTEVPANIEIYVNDSNGHPIAGDADPMIILNPGNKVFYPRNGVVSIENLAPAAYTVDAFADGYFAKSTSVNVPAGATFNVEIRLDEEIVSSADAELELKVSIDTVKHPSKVYIQIYNDEMELVANETATGFDATAKSYKPVNIEISSGRYTLLAIGEDLYNYVEAITIYGGSNTKEIKVIAKNACGNGIVDSAEECEPALSAPVLCGDIYLASTYPEKTATCDPATCTFDKTQCGKAALCGDGILDAGEGCDGGAKDCSEIAGFGSSRGTAPCAADCSGYITTNNCSKTTASCGDLPSGAVWNDGTGTFEQKYNGTEWLPATKAPAYGLTKDECTFSCAKGYRWNGSKCLENPISLALICTGEASCFDTDKETECPAYGEALFGQDAQYMEVGFCTQHTFSTNGSGDSMTVKDAFTHYEWTAKASENAMDWDAADDYCSHIDNESGSTAVWRLPSPAELLTIVNSGTANPALVDKFTTFGHTFWAKEDAKVSGNAWRIDETGAMTSVAKTTENSVICVRVHDYAPVENRFTAETETVKDQTSGLMWQKQPVASRTWAEALNYCEEVATADKFDWRLPNRNELASLINYEKANGAASDFPGIAAKGFWTSTTSMASTGSATAGAEAWTVDFADGSISSAEKNSTKYIICVRNDDPCFGDECPDTCGFDPCKNMDNSTGLCTAGDYDFTCGCKSGFNWNHAKCLLGTTRYIACEGLPENAVWNTVFGISQTYDGDKWYPSEVGSFNKISSNVECRFKCATNYKWDAENEVCVPESRMVQCSEKKPYSDWNSVSRISQTWNGEAWEPSSESEYNEEASEEKCRFVCKDHYNWDIENKICVAETQTAACTGLPANAEWHSATIEQTWNGSTWAPSTTGTHSTGAIENECHFRCIDEGGKYEWKNGACSAKPRTVQCDGLPGNAEWTGGYSSITQTWNGSEWFPGNAGTYNTEINSAYCRFKCLANYNWNGSTCEAATQIVSCGTLPANAIWNMVSQIKQTWNGSAWEPAKDPVYSNVSSETECRYTCKENYEWNDSACVAKKQTVACTGLPANAVWNKATVVQEWNGTTWTPETAGIHTTGNETDKCYFKCIEENEKFDWDTTTNTCKGHTKSNVACDKNSRPANASWWNANINQTWNGTEWLPTTTGSFSNSAVDNQCRFYCNAHYNWNGATCEAETKISACGTLPANAQWNSASSITQHWDDSTSGFVPTLTPEYGTEATTTYCRYKCKENYEWKNSSCQAATKTANCTGLPENAEWNTELAEGQITQEWNGNDWAPALTGSFGGQDAPAANSCIFKCINNYEWQGGLCVAKKQTAPCHGLPENAVWNSVATVYQEWKGAAWDPSDTGEFNEEPSLTECRFKCKDNFTWDGNGTCVPDTRVADCDPRPAHSVWNEAPSISQTWTFNGRYYEWYPYLEPQYSVSGSDTECRYKCDTNYYPLNGECVADPCDHDGYNPCDDVANSTGICEKRENMLLPYSCGCDSGFYWQGRTGCRTKVIAPGNICTDTVKCHDNTAEIACPAEGKTFFGQDAQYTEKGYCVPKNFTLEDIMIGGKRHRTTIDNNTGLEWASWTGQSRISWEDSQTFCETLEYGGHSDWRLPSIQELLTIVNFPNNSPALDLAYFSNGPLQYNVWSSTLVKDDSSKAWYLVARYGPSSYTLKTDASNTYVMCVRGDENTLPESSFEEPVDPEGNGEYVVKDSTTKLYWQQSYVNNKTWSAALSYCEDLEYGGYSDWRLPNINELRTLIDYEKSEPASSFPSNAQGQFWSSTSHAMTNSAHYVYFYNGVSASGGKTYTHSVRCVRSDLCDEGEFFDGTNCVFDPCTENSCLMEHSDGKCTPLTSSEYSCGCTDGYRWDESSESCAADPCFDNPCAEMPGSDGVCIPAGGTKFTCGCDENNFWNGSRCIRKRAYGNICTNQSRCFNETEEISCPSEGEDFYGQDKQYADKGSCTPQSFTTTYVEAEPVVTDNNTGLIWQGSEAPGTYTFHQAVSYCADLVYGGYSDWRMPNVEELVYLNDYENGKPIFITSNYFWSSVSYPTNKSLDINIEFLYYRGPYLGEQDKTSTLHVICVRGESLPKSTFTVSTVANGDQIITDNVTGLIWQKTYASNKTWKEALEYCEGLNYAGYTDWRLPNAAEIFTFSDPTRTSTPKVALAGYYGIWPNDGMKNFWSSTTQVSDTNIARSLTDYVGQLSYDNKTKGQYVRCVR